MRHRKLVLILIFFLTVLYPVNISSQQKCDPPPPPSGPPPDNPDDNYSFNLEGNLNVNTPTCIEEYPFIGIFNNGNVGKLKKLLKTIGRSHIYAEKNFNPEELAKNADVLIIPTGGLFGLEASFYFKALLEQFAAQGGTIICLAQQNSDAYGILPIPQGESLNAYGWSQDSSCLRNSVYFDSTHPALSSSTNELIDAGVDGYFSVYPSNSTILLKRKINLEPALLYYSYGNGTVILTSMFTDWASAHSQATTSEIKIFRDLVTFAKNPRLPIPMYNLEENPTPVINLNVQVKNNTEFTASKAILKVYSPDRATLLHELEAPVSLNQGESTQIAINFTLPEVQTKDYGICHVDYELYNAENEIIQLPTESDSGRFSIYKIITPVTIKDAVYMWVTVKDENVYWGQEAEFTIHFKNTTTETKTLDLNTPFFDLAHGRIGPSFPSFQVVLPPGGEYAHVALMSTSQFSRYAKCAYSVRIQYYDANGVLKQTGPGKVIFVYGTLTENTLTLNTPTSVAPCGTLNYSITSRYISDPLPGNTNLKLTLEKRNSQDSQYTEIQTLYQVDHDFNQSSLFQYNGSYTPSSAHPTGSYRLKLEVTAPNGLKEPLRYRQFYYHPSGFAANLGKIRDDTGAPATRLISGQTYTIPIAVKNLSGYNYEVKNGSCTLVLQAENSSETYRKEINGITIKYGEEKDLLETFVFTPTQLGTYSLKYRYWDETRECPPSFTMVQRLNCNTSVSVIPDKDKYCYLDIANVKVVVAGAGSYTIHFTCAKAGLDETRNVQIPQGSSSITELFQIPMAHISLSQSYTINVEVKDSLSITVYKNAYLPISPLQFDYNGNFSETFARAGSDLHLNLDIKNLSGMTNPLNGQLSVVSSQLNWQDVQTVTLQPLMDNPFTYTIPIDAGATEGVYRFDVQFKINDTIYVNKQHSISLPGPEIKFTSPGTVFNAGDAITFNFENTGGKNGSFEFDILLKDSLNKSTAEHHETLTIAAGTSNSLSLNLPGNLKTGKYQLVVKAVETISNETVERIFPISISGLSATLNSYPLKEYYFNDEVVSGKAEITPGTGNIENGVLNARIVKPAKPKTVEAIFSGMNCMTRDSNNRLWVGFYSGFAVYDGSTLQEITQLPDGTPLSEVRIITAAPNNKIYALVQDCILEIDNQQPFAIKAIPFRYGAWDRCNTIGVDEQSRIWAEYSGEVNEIYCYDAITHTWLVITGGGNARKIISDREGGVWILYNYKLSHIKSDLSIESLNSTGMPSGDYQFLYVAPDRKVWVVVSNTLYSFNGTTWTNFSNYIGYPSNGIITVTGDDSGNIYAVGINDTYSNSLYQVNNTGLVKKDAEFYSYSSSYDWSYYQEIIGGYLYTYGSCGSEGGEWISGLLKIDITGTGSNGSVEQTAWSNNYPIDLTSGSPLTLDLATGKTLDPGVYILKTQLLSSLEQVLAESNKTFSVQDHDVPVSISLNGPSDTSFNGVVKPGQELPLIVNITNNTTETHTGLTVIIKKTSPSGTVEEVLSENINLEPNQTITRIITFNETTPGTWQLTPQSIESETILKGSPMLITVAEPSVTMSVNAPNYAGSEPFAVNIKLKNEGAVRASLNAQGKITNDTGDGEIKLDESLTLEPGEERILTFSDTISTDTNYTITATISGDVEKTETVTVKYGYVENLSLNVLPTYREGPIMINYTLANTGGLPFTDTLHFELFNEGASLPLFTFDKTYNLYPDQSPIADTLNFPLSPGIYQLKYQSISIPPEIQMGREQALPVPSNTARGTFEDPLTGSPRRGALDPAKLLLGESLFTVLPSGLGNISLTTNTFPTGSNQIKYTITNTDSAPGQIPITITIFADDPATPILTETRNYYLQPNETLQDFIETNFPQKSNYTLSISGSKLTTPIITPIQILNPDETTAALTIGSPETNHIPITVDIANPGFNPFNGTLIIDASGIRFEEPITINSNSSFNQTFPIETNTLTPGTSNIKVFLIDASGETLSQTTSTVTISGPDIKVTEVPQNLEITAGSYADVALKLKNEGHLRGEAHLKISAFDTLYQEREISLEPGEEINIDGISIDTPADCPTGNYPFNYTLNLSGPGVTNSLNAGNFTFKVNGITLNVEATLDRSLYNIGETAQLTLSISSPNQSDAPLEAMVNWGNFSEKRTFIMSSGSGGSVSLVFEIPLDEKRQEKVFYGIYHEGGKGIHLNDIYLHFKDKISVESDKQVYAPGEIIHAIFTLTGGDQTGIISVDAFGENQTLPLSSTVSATFQVPADTIGGTYGINWRFVPSNTSQEELSGSHSFDVSGLVVKVAKSELEKGKYSSGETIKAAYTFEANRDDSLALRCWVATPSNQWTYLGENSVTVSADRQNNAVSSYSFTTNEAGTHDLVYGLYKDDKLVVSGRLAFDVGDAVLMGIATDKYEYKDGNENVIVRIDYFGEKTETLSRKGFSTSQSFSLLMDNEKVEERTLTINGPGHIEITLNSNHISGGSHLLKAILTGDGLASTKTAGFLYGTNLPDLTLSLADISSEGLNYTYQITVTNRGKTTSTATTLAFTDNGNPVETVSIPALAASASQEITFNWSGSGKAGSHEFMFEIDPTNTVKEYSEDNNRLTLSEEVPLLFYNLEVEPIIWPANSDIIIITRLINNQNSIAPLTLNLSIIHDSTGTAIFQRTRVEELPAFGNKALNDHFNTGVAPAGEYTLAQDVASDGATLHKEIDVLIETTKTISATLQLLPFKIPSGTDAEMEISMTLKNIGNVALEDETGVIEVVNKESQETVKAEQLLFTVPLGQEVAVKKAMTLNLVEGRYEIHLKYLDNVIGSAELTAAAAIKPEKIIAVRPRVLIMNLQMPGSADPVVFLNNLFQSAEIQHETAQGILESYFQFHKGHANINIVLGHTMGRRLRDELKERVWRGEGLILICGNPINAPDMVDWLGVNVSPQTGKEKTQTVVEILPNELTGGGGQMELLEKNRLILEKKSADVVIVGQTLQKKQPVMTYRKYGRGHILVIAAPVAPLAYKSGGEMIAQLLVNAVNLFSGDIYTISTLTRVLPVEISLSNEGTEEKNLIVKEILPYGVEGYDYNPALEDTGEENEIQWSIKVPGGATENISYWLKLPDQAGNYEVKTEIHDGETKLEEVSLDVDVSQAVLSRIIDTVVELEALDVSGHDANAIRQAKTCLENIRGRSVGSLADHLQNLHDAVQAVESIGSVTGLDVSSLRLKAGDIMVIMGRRLYEEVKQWGPSRLNPFTGLITAD